MERYTRLISGLIIVFTVSAILPPGIDEGAHLKPADNTVMLSSAVAAVYPVLSDPTPFRGRIFPSSIAAGYYCQTLKDNRFQTACCRMASDYHSGVHSEITLFSLDCMLQI